MCSSLILTAILMMRQFTFVLDKVRQNTFFYKFSDHTITKMRNIKKGSFENFLFSLNL